MPTDTHIPRRAPLIQDRIHRPPCKFGCRHGIRGLREIHPANDLWEVGFPEGALGKLEGFRVVDRAHGLDRPRGEQDDGNIKWLAFHLEHLSDRVQGGFGGAIVAIPGRWAIDTIKQSTLRKEKVREREREEGEEARVRDEAKRTSHRRRTQR